MKIVRYPAILLGESSRKSFLRPEELLRRIGLRPGQRVIDLGSGAGHFTLPAAQVVGSRGRVYAVDRDLDILSRLEKRAHEEGLRNIELLGVDFEDLPTHLSTPIDLAILGRVLSRVENPSRLFRVAERVTEPDGQVVVVEWRSQALDFGRGRERLDEEKLLTLAQGAGLRLAERVDGGGYHTVLLFSHDAPVSRRESL